MITLQNLIATNHSKSAEDKNDSKLSELDVVTTQIQYHVNGLKKLKNALYSRSIRLYLKIKCKKLRKVSINVYADVGDSLSVYKDTDKHVIFESSSF